MNHWTNYWHSEITYPICKNPPSILYGGTNQEPLASIGMSCFLDAVKTKFKENFSVIDYGCGAGILSNFISSRLHNFTYLGLEPRGEHGIERINLGKTHLNDSRVKFGFTDEFSNINKNKVDAIILISVFTHLIFDDIKNILNDLLTVYEKNPNCTIVFSCFIDDESHVKNHQPNIWERFYGESHITLVDLQTYCNEHGVNLEKHMEFIAQGGYIHQIFKITKI
jgi:2-polyprenyl-3-methyl-5-hydroxy-6-metoxy-1,4-benzoquinol methylase